MTLRPCPPRLMERPLLLQSALFQSALFQSALLLCLLVALLFCVTPAHAAEAPPSWQHLSATQQHILAPLKADWSEFDHDRKKKWLDIAARYPAMSPQQQKTLQQRMNEWAHLSPEKRRLARENFLSTGKTPQQSRREAWEAYQKLPQAERERLKEEARHPKPHPGQVGKYLQEKQAAASHAPPVKPPVKPAPQPPLPASAPIPAKAASAAVPCTDVLRCPAR